MKSHLFFIALVAICSLQASLHNHGNRVRVLAVICWSDGSREFYYDDGSVCNKDVTGTVRREYRNGDIIKVFRDGISGYKKEDGVWRAGCFKKEVLSPLRFQVDRVEQETYQPPQDTSGQNIDEFERIED